MDRTTKDDIEKLIFPGSRSNANYALRTLRRMFTKAKEGKRVRQIPDFSLFKERGQGRSAWSAAETFACFSPKS